MSEVSALFQHNLALFHERFPSVAARLAAIAEPKSSIVWENGVAENIDLGGTMLYPQPASAWINEQLKTYGADPDRLGFTSPSHCNISQVSSVLHRRLIDYGNAHCANQELAPYPVVDVGFLFVFGVGLGRHLKDLICQTAAQNIVITEQMDEFLWHSLQAIDWHDVLTRADERGATVRIVVESDPSRISAAIEKIVIEKSNVFLDGSFFYLHYYSWYFKQTYELLKDRLKTRYLSSGFYEDEVEMIRNCYENLKRWPFRLLDGRHFRQQSLPVFLIGAGPSLDQDLAIIRKWRERTIAVSCGTALGILLKNGIRPDLHVELERGALVYDIVSALHREYGLEGITLIASTTVDPRLGELFDRRWFFVRGALSPSVILMPEAPALAGVDPLCCNAAFASITSLGFQDIYLFGLDLAQKEAGRHHAKDSVYFKEGNGELDEMYRKRFNMTVPGNFGGTVQTFWAFDIGRQAIAAIQSRRRVNLYNCSDGALIYGAQRKVAASVRLPADLPPRARVLAAIEAHLPEYQAGEFLASSDLRAHIGGCDVFRVAIGPVLDEAARSDGSFVALKERLDRFVRDHQEPCRGFFSLALSSMTSMLRLASFFGSRIADEAARQAFFAFFIEAYRERCVALADMAKEFLETIEADKRQFDAVFERLCA
jgi:hypothetical protein